MSNEGTDSVIAQRLESLQHLVHGRNVKDMVITVARNLGFSSILMPQCLFEIDTLTSLKIGDDFELKLHVIVNLPSLKKLSMHVSDGDHELMATLFKSCPILDYLKLVGVFLGESSFNLEIVCDTLKHLSLSVEDAADGSSINIDTPNLECFYLEDRSMVKINFRHFDSLMDMKGTCSHVLLHAIDGVRCLEISGSTLTTFYSSEATPPMYRNLTKITTSFPAEWTFLHWFLQCCPFVKSLELGNTVKNLDLVNEYAETDWTYSWSKFTPGCLLNNITESKLFDLVASEPEMRMITHFLKCSNTIKLLDVKVNGRTSAVEWAFFRKLIKLSELSSNCELKFAGNYVNS